VSVDDAEGVGADELFYGVKDGLFEVVGGCVIEFDEVDDDFGVGVGGEGDAVVSELFFEFQVVFNDSVMDYCELFVLAYEWMGVFVGGGAVGGPARMGDAYSAGEGG